MSAYKQQIVWGKNHYSNWIHFAAGAFICFITYKTLRWLGWDIEMSHQAAGCIMGVVVGYLWEFFRQIWFKKIFDWKDVVYTWAGSVVALILLLIFTV